MNVLTKSYVYIVDQYFFLNVRSLCLLHSVSSFHLIRHANKFASRRTPFRVESTVYSMKRTCTNQPPMFVYRANILILVAWRRTRSVCNLRANESTMMHDDVPNRTCLQVVELRKMRSLTRCVNFIFGFCIKSWSRTHAFSSVDHHRMMLSCYLDDSCRGGSELFESEIAFFDSRQAGRTFFRNDDALITGQIFTSFDDAT